MTGLKKKLFTAACALFICAVLSACGISSPEPSKIGNVTKDQTPEGTAETKKAAETPKTTEAPLKDVYHVGDIVEIKGAKIIYTASGEYVSPSAYVKPNDGNKFIYLEFYVENIGSGTVSVSYFDFDAYADGYAVDQKYFDEDSLSGGLSAGRWEIGKIYFEVPVNASEIEAEYEYDVFNSKKLKFAYEGEKIPALFRSRKQHRPTALLSPATSLMPATSRSATLTAISLNPATNTFSRMKETYSFTLNLRWKISPAPIKQSASSISIVSPMDASAAAPPCGMMICMRPSLLAAKQKAQSHSRSRRMPP